MNNKISLKVTPNARSSLSCINRLREKWKDRATKKNYKVSEIFIKHDLNVFQEF